MTSLPLDHAGQALEQWKQVRPELDMTPAFVLARMRRLMSILEPMLERELALHGLNHASFDTLSALRRGGEPYRMSASELAAQCLRTPATLSARIARLETEGLIRRSADPNDGRASIIGLTEHGLRLIDEVAPIYLDVEKLALDSLTDDEHSTLSEILQRLLLGFEDFDDGLRDSRQSGVVPALGLRVESPHRTRQLRRAVGIPDRQGNIVAEVTPHGPADRAGIARGDLLVAVDGRHLASVSILNHELAERASAAVDLTVAREGAPDRVVSVEPAADLEAAPARS